MINKIINKLKRILSGFLVRINKYINIVHISYTPDYIYNLNLNKNLLELWSKKNPSNDLGDLARLNFFIYITQYIKDNNIEGDIAELGVYKGTTARIFKELLENKRIYLFDTFEGFSEDDINLYEKRNGLKNEFLDTSLKMVQNFVGVDDRTFYFKGYFPSTTTQLLGDEKYALVHLDPDLYAPVKSGCEYFYPKLVKGGCMIIHDYYSTYYDGVKKAVDEFFKNKIEIPVPIGDKSGSVVIIKE